MRFRTELALLLLALSSIIVIPAIFASDGATSESYPTDVHYKFTVTFDVPGVTGCAYYTVDFGDDTSIDSREDATDEITCDYDSQTGSVTYHITHTYPEVPRTYTMLFTAFNTDGAEATNGLNVCLMGYPVVSFDSYGGYEEQVVKNGEANGGSAEDDYYTKAVRPEDPVREGYEFTGWYTDADLTTLFNWDEPVRSDVSLHAGWKEKTGYTVTFYVNRVPYDQKVYQPGETIIVPESPVKEGYQFIGWKNYTEGMTATRDIGFCARFVADETPAYKVTYTIDGVSYNTYITSGGSLDAPEANGRQFEGWYTDEALTQPFDSSNISSDMVVYPKFTENQSTDSIPYVSIVLIVLGIAGLAAGYRRYPVLMVIGAAAVVAGAADASGIVQFMPR